MRWIPSKRRCARQRSFEQFEDRLVLSTVTGSDGSLLPTEPAAAVTSDWIALTSTAVAVSDRSATQQLHDTYGFQGAGQTVVVIDSGVAYDHLALGGGLGGGCRVVGGWDFTEERDADPYDDGPAGFHGTHVAGIIAAADGQYPGLAPAVDLVALRVFNDLGEGRPEWVEQALQWVHTHRDDFRYPITTVNLSLGISWNGAAPPSWATLEEELAALDADGVFVAAAAGNDFDAYDVAGLGYPAASPYVIPVASVDANGQLSWFSQRTDRVLAAPGEQIVSTVPDFLLGTDGVPNDWLAATGTSMAAPYVAGSAVLVRQAMEFVHDDVITPSAIYTHLRNTADLVYDSATNATYARVNLDRALAALLPADEYGSTADQATPLGTLEQAMTVTGVLSRLDDSDWFQIVAGQTGRLQLDLSATTEIRLTDPADGQTLLTDCCQLQIDVVAGTTYRFAVDAADELACYELDLTLTPATPIWIDGSVVHVAGTCGADVIVFSAAGPLTVQVNGQSLQLPTGTDWQFQIDGNGGSDRLVLRGSRGDDLAVLRPGSACLRGAGYSLSAERFAEILVDGGGGGHDLARLYDSAGDDQFVASPRSAVLSGSGFSNQVSDFAEVYGYATGSRDVARFYDSSGDDLFVSRPTTAWLSGSGFYNRATGFAETYAYSCGTSRDIARFYGSTGDDLFVAGPDTAWLKGCGFYNRASGFAQCYAYAAPGGDDIARLYDSAGDDLYVARPDTAWLQGQGFYNRASGFAQCYAYAQSGTRDIARFYDSAGDDLFTARPDTTWLRGAGFYNRASGFAENYAYGSAGGQNTARFYDSSGDDLFVTRSDTSWMSGPGYYNRTSGFACNYAFASGNGGDAVRFYSTSSHDAFFADGESAWLTGDTFLNQATGFRQHLAVATASRPAIARLQVNSRQPQWVTSGSRVRLGDGLHQFDLIDFDQVLLEQTSGLPSTGYLGAVDYLFSQVTRLI